MSTSTQRTSEKSKSTRAQQADELWNDGRPNGGNGGRAAGYSVSKRENDAVGMSRRPLSYDTLAISLSSPTMKLSPSGAGGHRMSPLPGGNHYNSSHFVSDAFEAYHNFHQNGGADTIMHVTAQRRGGGVRSVPHDGLGGGFDARRQVLEKDHFPIRPRTQALQMVGELRGNPARQEGPMGAGSSGGGGAYFSPPSSSHGPTPYTYTGGFASTVFASPVGSSKTIVTDEEKREAYRERHRQAYTALASVKPFLVRIFEDGDAADAEEVGGSSSSGAVVGAAAASSHGQRGEMSRALYHQERGKLGSYAKVDASHVPSWSYEDMVRRESAKPLLLNTVVTTDRCPLTTKTCPPTYTSFEALAQSHAVATDDREALDYFSNEVGSEAKSSHGGGPRGGGGGRLSFSSSLSNTSHSRKDFAAASAAGVALVDGSGGGGTLREHLAYPMHNTVVSNGTVQSGSLNVGMRAFRDLLLPTPPPTSIATIVSARNGGSALQVHDEAALLKEAHLANLKWAIHSTKKVSERNHLAAALDYDMW